MSKTNITVRMARDGTLTRIVKGKSEIISAPLPTPMDDAAIEAAALSDPDAQPLTPEKLAQLKRVPRVKTLRRALGITQEEFSQRYHIPLGTLRDWEQGRSEPDQPTRAYLTVIAREPERVRKALETSAA